MRGSPESKRHGGHLSQDIVDSSPAEGDAARLVVAGGVEGQLADQGAVVGEDPDVLVGDQEMDGFAAVSPADADVVEAAEVAEGGLAGLVDAIVADAEVGLGGGADGVGFEAGVEGDQWGLAAEGPMGPEVVVEGAEGVELELELGERVGWRLAGQEALEGLVEAFDLAAGLGVVGAPPAHGGCTELADPPHPAAIRQPVGNRLSWSGSGRPNSRG